MSFFRIKILIIFIFYLYFKFIITIYIILFNNRYEMGFGVRWVNSSNLFDAETHFIIMSFFKKIKIIIIFIFYFYFFMSEAIWRS